VICIGEPISWLRLEQHALARDAQVAAHLDACPACRACFAELGPIELPRLVFAAARPRRRWLWLAAPGLALAAVIALLLWPRPRPDNVVAIKGGGELVLGVVRERAGAIVEDARAFLPGDRWKLVVTCPPAASTWLDVVVLDGGEPSYPLAPAHVTCGNRIVLPGAFTLTGDAPNRVCVRVSETPKGPGDLACVTIVRE
jgi:hypothetical protein